MSEITSLSPSLSQELQGLIQKLLAHPLYHHVQTVSALRIFMREHAFAVWDFMTLLKRLQHDLCGTHQPWRPPQHPALARFVNEIVLGEESDTDNSGGFTSHFQLYLTAMRELGADTQPIEKLVESVSAGADANAVLDELPIQSQTREFVKFNLQIARNASPWEVAAVFCHGREDVIPAMFERLLQPLRAANLGTVGVEYYLQRHIELDGNDHGPLSLRLLSTLIGDSPPRAAEALSAGQKAIESRIHLWDGILQAICECDSRSSS